VVVAAKKAGSVRKLPAFGWLRAEAALALLARVVDEHAEGLAIDALKHQHALHEASGRQLEASEAMHIAAAIGDAAGEADVVGLAERVQQSTLRAHDAVGLEQTLGRALAGRLIPLSQHVLQLISLVEMPKALFDSAYDEDTLDAEIEKAVHAIKHADEPLSMVRERAVKVVEHVSAELGQSAGEAVSLFATILQQFAARTADRLGAADSSSLTGSLEPTDGLGETSSSTLPTENASTSPA